MKNLLLLILLLPICLYLPAQDSVPSYFPSIESEYQKGLDALSSYQYEKASAYFYECVRHDPTNVLYLSKLAWAYLQAGNLAEAKIYYREILKKDTLHLQAISNLGYLFEKEQNYAKAQEYYEQLIEIDSTNSYYYRLNAFCALHTERMLPALAYFHKAHRLNPKDLVVIQELAKLYLNVDALDYAEKIIHKGLEISPEYVPLITTAARIANLKKNYPGVIQLLEKAQALGDSTPYYQTMLAYAYLETDSLYDATFQLERLVERRKDTEHTHHYLSIAYDLLGQSSKSVHHLEKALQKAISQKVPIYYQELGKHYERKKQYKKALDYYTEAYAHSQKPVYLYFIARNTDLYFKDKSMALRWYKKYIASGHKKYREYTTYRIKELKEIIHQSKKSVPAKHPRHPRSP